MAKKTKKKTAKRSTKSKIIYNVYYHPTGRSINLDHKPTSAELYNIVAKRFLHGEEDDVEYINDEVKHSIEVTRERIVSR